MGVSTDTPLLLGEEAVVKAEKDYRLRSIQQMGMETPTLPGPGISHSDQPIFFLLCSRGSGHLLSETLPQPPRLPKWLMGLSSGSLSSAPSICPQSPSSLGASLIWCPAGPYWGHKPPGTWQDPERRTLVLDTLHQVLPSQDMTSELGTYMTPGREQELLVLK